MSYVCGAADWTRLQRCLRAKAFEIAASVGMIVPWVLESNGCEDE